jgi:hypothetical protein
VTQAPCEHELRPSAACLLPSPSSQPKTQDTGTKQVPKFEVLSFGLGEPEPASHVMVRLPEAMTGKSPVSGPGPCTAVQDGPSPGSRSKLSSSDFSASSLQPQPRGGASGSVEKLRAASSDPASWPPASSSLFKEALWWSSGIKHLGITLLQARWWLSCPHRAGSPVQYFPPGFIQLHQRDLHHPRYKTEASKSGEGGQAHRASSSSQAQRAETCLRAEGAHLGGDP